MNVKELVDEVSRRADTPGTGISRPVTGRVVSKLFDVLAEQPPLDALDLINREFRRRARLPGSRSACWIHGGGLNRRTAAPEPPAGPEDAA